MMKWIFFHLTICKDCMCVKNYDLSNCLAQIINAANVARYFPYEKPLLSWHQIADPAFWATKQTPYEKCQMIHMRFTRIYSKTRIITLQVSHGSSLWISFVFIVEENRILVLNSCILRQMLISISWRREKDRKRIFERRDCSIINTLCTFLSSCFFIYSILLCNILSI